jgi:hypothetical protein
MARFRQGGKHSGRGLATPGRASDARDQNSVLSVPYRLIPGSSSEESAGR